jgi:hypothetical protein
MTGIGAGNYMSAVAQTVSPGLAQLYSKRIAPTAGWSDMGRSEHFIQFYETDDFIVNSIAEYVIHGLRSGETCIVIATGGHLIGVEKIINSYTNGLETARKEGRYIPLDTVDTLSKLMVGEMPDRELFSSVTGEMVAKAAGNGYEFRVFSEMVRVLCSEGKYAAAVRLEELWNGLRKSHSFPLFCAYSMAGLRSNPAGEHMTGICNNHSRVIPDESYTLLASANERLRAIAFLQQRSRQLEAEVAEFEQLIALKQMGH